MHNGPADAEESDPPPGQTYSILVDDVTFTSGTNVNLNVGNYAPRWTAMGALAFSLFRFHDNITDSTIHVSDLGGENPTNMAHCAANVMHHTDPATNTSFIRLVTVDGMFCGKHDQDNKFVVSHELGHSYSFLAAGVGDQVPASSTHAEEPSACPFGTMSQPYGNLTKEWSSLAMREGFAHFYAARVWNDEAADGQFRWDTSFDLERFSASDPDGGYIVNLCCVDNVEGTPAECAASLDGAGVITDWLRALWDQHTDASCPLNKFTITRMYVTTLLSSGLTDENFWENTQAFVAYLGATCIARWDENGCHNGIDREGAVWSGC